MRKSTQVVGLQKKKKRKGKRECLKTVHGHPGGRGRRKRKGTKRKGKNFRTKKGKKIKKNVSIRKNGGKIRTGGFWGPL